MSVLLSRIEMIVLQAIVTVRTLPELQAELADEFEPERVDSAVKFLRRRRLVEQCGEDWTVTEIGARILERELDRRRRERRHLNVA
jgi:hypothetical protein